MTSYKPLMYSLAFIFGLGIVLTLLSFYVDTTTTPSGVGGSIFNLFSALIDFFISAIGLVFSVIDVIINAFISLVNAVIKIANFLISPNLPLVSHIDLAGFSTEFFTSIFDYVLNQMRLLFLIPDMILIPIIILTTFGIVWTLWAMVRGN